MPFGLMRKTRPFDCSWPRIDDGSWPTTRLSTLLEADGWMNSVRSPRRIENCCQLMIAPRLLVMLSVLPLEAKLTVPAATEAPEGLAKEECGEVEKARLTAIARLDRCSVVLYLSLCPTARFDCSGNRDAAPEDFPYP